MSTVADVRGRPIPCSLERRQGDRRCKVRLCPDHIWFEGWVGKAKRRETEKKKRKETCIKTLLAPGDFTHFILILTTQLLHNSDN